MGLREAGDVGLAEAEDVGLGEAGGMGLREAGKARRRSQILDAAAVIIERDGADGLTMRRLAQDAGVSYATVYNLVGAREDVLVALVDRAVDERVAELEAIADDDPLSRCRQVLLASVDHLVARPRLYRPLLTAIHDPSTAPRGLPVRARLIAVYASAIADGMRRGVLAEDLAPELVARQVVYAFNAALQRWAHGATSPPQFAAEARYGLGLCLLGIADRGAREELLAELQGLERALDSRAA